MTTNAEGRGEGYWEAEGGGGAIYEEGLGRLRHEDLAERRAMRFGDGSVLYSCAIPSWSSVLK